MKNGNPHKNSICLSVLFVLFFCVFCAVPASAADIQQIYELSRDQDPKFKGAGFGSQASKESLDQAWSGLLPSLVFEYKYGLTYQDIQSTDNTVFAKGTTDFATQNYTLLLTQPIFKWSAIVGVRQARRVVSRADAELEFAHQDLILRVAERYLNVLAAEDGLAFATAEKQSVESQHELAEARHNAGLAPITDLYDARARLAAVDAQQIEAQNALDDAIQALSELSGGAVSDLAALKEDMPLAAPEPAGLEDLMKTAEENNLELKIQRFSVEVADQEVKRQRAEHYPVLELVGRGNRQETEGTLFGGGSKVNTYDVALQFTMPIYEGGVVSSRTQEAIYKHSQELENLEAKRRGVERQVRATYSGTIAAISRALSLQKSIEAQSLVLEAKQRGYESGLFTGLDVLDATRDLYYYKKDYARARYDYILNTLRLKQATGSLNEENVSEVNTYLN